MQIETYECEELKNSEATTLAVDAEAVALIEQLGLEGQQSLTNKETLTREPYREMTKLEHFVWRSVAPETTEVSKYRLSPMPLRILQVIAYARSLDIYTRVEVWHPKVVKTDPLLVGVPRGQEYTYCRHLIARWGNSLEPFEQALERAKGMFARQFTAKLEQFKREIEAVQADVGARVQLSFDKEDFDLPTQYNVVAP